MDQQTPRLRHYLDYLHRTAAAAFEDVHTVNTHTPGAAERLQRLLERADQTMADRDAANDWVASPLGVLGGRSPAEAALSGEAGLQEAIAVLGRLDHGVYS